jgi:peroxin-4
MNISVTRLNKELNHYQQTNNSDVNRLEEQFHCKIKLGLRGDSESIFSWYAKITGPKDSPYENGTFLIQIDVPTDYPVKPPKCKFITKIFHPNIHLETGEICHELLKDKWSPSCNLETVCRSILDMINNPYQDSPLNCDAGNLLRCNDLVGYYYIAKMYTIDYAIEN